MTTENLALTEESLEKLQKSFSAELGKAKTAEELDKVKVKYLGRKGEVRKLFELLVKLPADKKRSAGEMLNKFSKDLQAAFDAKAEKVVGHPDAPQPMDPLAASLPGVALPVGSAHPLQQVYDEIVQVFVSLGFAVAEGPEIEVEDYNFSLLNIPEDHPARDMQDTFYVDLPASDQGKYLLRTHTSPVQVRLMKSQKPPLKAIMPGRVFRNDSLDATHQFNFHQVEGLVVDKGIRLSDLKGTLSYMLKALFGNTTGTRFRQSYFQFTEPSLEVDMLRADGKYLEVAGCGMVHPQVLKNVGIDPEVYTGFAFGLGVERIAFLKYGIDDLRHFFANDLRFLKQF